MGRRFTDLVKKRLGLSEKYLPEPLQHCSMKLSELLGCHKNRTWGRWRDIFQDRAPASSIIIGITREYVCWKSPSLSIIWMGGGHLHLPGSHESSNGNIFFCFVPGSTLHHKPSLYGGAAEAWYAAKRFVQDVFCCSTTRRSYGGRTTWSMATTAVISGRFYFLVNKTIVEIFILLFVSSVVENC